MTVGFKLMMTVMMPFICKLTTRNFIIQRDLFFIPCQIDVFKCNMFKSRVVLYVWEELKVVLCVVVEITVVLYVFSLWSRIRFLMKLYFKGIPNIFSEEQLFFGISENLLSPSKIKYIAFYHLLTFITKQYYI